MAFPPYTRGRNEEESRKADAEKMVTSQEGHVGEGALEFDCEGDSVGREERRESCGDDTEQR
jgi:hypothetical protein